MAWRTDFKGPSSPPPPPPPPGVPPRPFDASPPPAYEEAWHSPALPLESPMLAPEHAWHTGDPRSSSTQSLIQHLHDDDARRILLIVYIHGFMGDNTSFRSFPAHVHYYLKSALAESHVIHSKLYPRYKTYKAIEVARDNFSAWLEPHESDKTDVVLVGHSMGGLLAAEVALMPSRNPVYGHAFKHRILGTVSLDAPLLGLHPGIIKSGIASLFRKAPDPPGKQQELANSLASGTASGSLSPDDGTSFSTAATSYNSGPASSLSLTSTPSNAAGPSHQDPNFNPPFFNDVAFVDRGWLRNVAHFAKKHYNDGLFSSTYQHLTSHLEFGSCLADYPGMNNRYNKIRRLEDVDALHTGGSSGRKDARVRFVNFYTVSTGIPKEPPVQDQPPMPKRADTHLRPEMPASRRSSQAHVASSGTSTPRISIGDYSDNEGPLTMQFIDPVPEPDSEPEQAAAVKPPSPKSEEKGETPASANGKQVSDAGVPPEHHEQESGEAAASSHGNQEGEDDAFTSDLPAIPDAPDPPEAPDFERYKDKDARKQAEKEFKRVQKTYDQAVKNREKALKERQKLVEKRRKKAQKEADKRTKEEEKRLAKEQKDKDAAAQKEAKNEEAAEATDPAAARSQVVTQAQAQALERQLTDLAFHNNDDDPGVSSPSTTLSPVTTTTTNATRTTTASAATAAHEDGQPKKLRKFCMLPPKANGARDKCWVKVYMEGVDEVGAHCGLFFSGPHYEKLVGEVGGMIVGWVQEDMSTRAILALD
ncbi:unnamed protein product [Discula destructiva]